MERKNQGRFAMNKMPSKHCWNCGACMLFDDELGIWICKLCGSSDDDRKILNGKVPFFVN